MWAGGQAGGEERRSGGRGGVSGGGGGGGGDGGQARPGAPQETGCLSGEPGVSWYWVLLQAARLVRTGSG